MIEPYNTDAEFLSRMKLVCGQRCCYRAEGNVNLALHLLDANKVILLRKTNVEFNVKQHCRETYEAELRDELVRICDYMGRISMLFGDEFVIEREIYRLPINDYEQFNELLKFYRPVERLNRHVQSGLGLISIDAAFLPANLMTPNILKADTPTYAIEIKPKQCWPLWCREFRHLRDEFNLKDVRKCRYCSMQYLKKSQGKINEISSYCPLDLFSGDFKRMFCAIHGLIRSPQNNFHIFKNGKSLYATKYNETILKTFLNDIFMATEEFNSLSNLIQFLMAILLKDYNEESNDIQLKDYNECNKFNDFIETSCQFENVKLPDSSVLKQIHDVQLLFKEAFLSIHQREKDTPGTILNSSPTILDNYRFGATALDCAILIAFHPIDDRIFLERMTTEQRKHVIQLNNGSKFLTKVQLMDFDEKSVEAHYKKYLRLSFESHSAAKINSTDSINTN